MGPLEAGWWSVPSGLAFIVGSMVAPVMGHRFRPAYVMATGLAISALGFAVLSQVGADSHLAWVVTGSVIFSFGLTPVVSLTTDLLVGAAPPERAGAAAACRRPARSSAVRWALPFWAAWRRPCTERVCRTPCLRGLPPRPRKQRAAPSAAPSPWPASFPSRRRSTLVDAARDAFVQGLQVSAAISALVLLSACVLALVTLRQARLGGA